MKRILALGAVVSVTMAALTAAVTTVGIAGPAAVPAAAAGALLCDQNTIYGIDASNDLRAINLTTGVATEVRSVAPATNALGITNNGVASYQYSGPTRQITRYDPGTNAVTTFSNVDAQASTTIIRGAINPANGIFYYGGSGASAYVGAFDTKTNTPIGQVATLTGLQNLNGDFAFSSRGQLFVVSGAEVRRVDRTVPTVAGNATLTTSLVATLPAGTNSPGISFSSDGYLYVSSTTNLLKLDPAAGTVVATIPITSSSGAYSPSDLASCNYPNTITVQKNVVGRVNPTDEFGLSVVGGGITSGNTATTTGSTDGLQAEQAGAALTVPGRSYDVAETAAGTTDLANYVSTVSCLNVDDGTTVVSATGTSAAFVFPAVTTADGLDVVCTFTNTPKTASLALTKVLNGARSAGADQFTVAVRGTGPGGPVLNDTAHSTTTGTGAVVNSGSGTTGATTVVVAHAYYLTEALATGSPSSSTQYTATISCTDPTGLQTGLPSGAPFTGSLAITPVAGAAIACTVTNSPVPVPPTILVKTVLGSDRYAAGDQFTEAIRTGGTGGSVVNATAAAATTGTGSVVDGGTGTTGTYVATAGMTYSVTDGFTANAAQYTTTISCTDSSGHQTGLPTGLAFTGSLDLVLVSGAAITCVLTQTAIPAPPTSSTSPTATPTTPATTPTPTPSTPAPAGNSSAALPDTGTNSLGLFTLGAVLLGLGAGLAALGRRRRLSWSAGRHH